MYTTAYLSERAAENQKHFKFGASSSSVSNSSTRAEQSKILPQYQETPCGFKIPKCFSLDAFRSALEYMPRPDDLFIVTYPNCGTTWLQNIVACIFRNGKPFESALEFFTNTPFLEMAGAEAARNMRRPGAIKLHLPFHIAPWSSQAKYIFIARNPKDCCVSLYHRTKNLPGYKFKNGTFDDFFELFLEGKVDFGDYFDTLLSWYDHRNDQNVLFLTYEGLKKDVATNVLRIAKFMGSRYENELSGNPQKLQAVVRHSSFEFMKETLDKQVSLLAATPRIELPDLPQGLRKIFGSEEDFFDAGPDSITFCRKGIVGDYKNYFSEDQNLRLENKFKQRTKGTDIGELWIGIV